VQSELSVHADDLTFDEPLRQAVPWRVRRMWNNMSPEGRFDLHLDRLHVASRQEQPPQIELQGQAKLHGMAMDLGVQLSDAAGIVAGRLAWEGEALTLDLNVNLDRAKVDGRALTDVSARLQERPEEQKLHLRDVQAGFYEGRIMGDVEITRQARRSRYGITLNLQGVALDAFLNARRAEDEPPTEMKGILDGNLSLTGTFGRPQSRRGGGSIIIRRAELFKVPLMLAILQVIHFAIDDDNAIHDARATFAFDGEDLILQEIDMRGKALSMVGAGRVHTPSQKMDIVLLVGSPLELPRVEILSELMEGVARELMEVHVEGPVADPNIRAEIVRSIRATLETILNLRRPESTIP